jgi:hypothetical protein
VSASFRNLLAGDKINDSDPVITRFRCSFGTTGWQQADDEPQLKIPRSCRMGAAAASGCTRGVRVGDLAKLGEDVS